MTNIPPPEHLNDAVLLVADAIVELFEIRLPSGGTICLKNNDTLTWQGVTWEGTAINMTGAGRSSDEKAVRPQLTVRNPVGAYSNQIARGVLDFALVRRIRVLNRDIEDNRNKFYSELYFISRIVSLTGQSVVMELRTISDRVNAVFPARMFIPPEFPLVTMQ